MSLRSCIPVLLTTFALPLFAADIAEQGGATGTLKGNKRKPEPILHEASNEPVTTMQKFRLQAGFKAEVWAAEPMLGNPVAFSIDEQGRIFTSETYRYRTSVLDIRNYMFMLEDDLASRSTDDRIAYTKKNFPKDWQELEKETEVIRVIEDTKGTGKADSSKVYADGFNTMLDGIASGVLAHYGKVWFTNMPNLWMMTGLKPDGRAETKTSLSFGYGVRFSFTGHDMHGLALGPDGRLYFSFGDRGAYVKTKEGKTLAFSDEGGVFRCELDGSHMEAVYRGLRNPQELAFDNHGNLFTGDNDCDMGDRERWVYLVEGGDSAWRVGWQHPPLGKDHDMWLVEKMWEPRKDGTPLYLLSPILNIPDGPSGVVHNPGTGLPSEYEDAFFVCGFKGSNARSAISWWKVKETGAGFATDKSPASFVDNVQATDVDFGPDSRMYFTDWGDGWEGTGRGRIYKMEHEAARQAQAAQIAEVQKLLKEGFEQRSSDELAKLLAHKDQRIRLNAQWALATKADAAAKFLAVAKTGTDQLARLHAVWGLGHIARLASYKAPAQGTAILEPLLALVGDKDDEVRAQVIAVLGDGHVEKASGALIKALTDPASRVQFFAAQGLGKLGKKEAVEPVLAMLRANDDKDQFLRHAGVMALLGAAGQDGIAKAAKDDSRAVRVAALIAMRRTLNPAVAGFLADKDPIVVKEAARAISDEGIKEGYAELAKLVAAPISDEHIMFRALNAAYRLGTPAAAQSLADFAAKESTPEAQAVEAVRLLGLWPKPAARDRVAGVFRPMNARDAKPAIAALSATLPKLLAAKAVNVAKAAIESAQSLGAKEVGPTLFALMGDSKSRAAVRLSAIDALAAFNDPKLSDAIKLAIADKDSALRIEATALLAKINPDEAAKELTAAFANSAVPEKKVIVNSLGDLKSAASDKTLSAMLDDLKAGKFAPEVQLELIEAANKSKDAAVKAKVKAYESAIPATDFVAKYSSALMGGDRKNGEKLFKEHAVAQCFRCHKVGGQGGDAGPDLSKIAATKDRKYILESIVNPNAAIAEGFQSVLVTMKNGDMQMGIVKSETADELSIQTPAPGVPPVKLKKADIKSREASAASGMPPGFGDTLNRRDLRDIVEYVSSLK